MRSLKHTVLVGIAFVAAVIIASSMLFPWRIYLTGFINGCPPRDLCPDIAGWNTMSGWEYVSLLFHARLLSGWALMNIVLSLLPVMVSLLVVGYCLLWCLTARNGINARHIVHSYTRATFVWLLIGVVGLLIESLTFTSDLSFALLGNIAVVGVIYAYWFWYFRHQLKRANVSASGTTGLAPTRLLG